MDLNGNGKLDIEFRDLGNSAGFVDGWVVNGLDFANTGSLPAAAPQALPGLTFDADGMDARSQAILNSLVQSGETLTDERLRAVVADAVARWSSLGLTAEQLARLNSVDVQIADLDSQGDFGVAGSGDILIDNDALGLGWHVGNGPVPANQVDLLSVVLHELGHIVGYGDLDPQQFPNSLMAGEIQAGQERGLEGFDLASGTNRSDANTTVAAAVAGNSDKTLSQPSSADLFGHLAGSANVSLSLGSASREPLADQPETVDTPVIVNERKRIADHDAVFLGFDLIFDEL